MNTKMVYKILVILIVMLTFIYITPNFNFAKINTNIEIGNDLRNDAAPVANKVLGAMKVVGVFVFLGMTMVVGIKYMLSSVEGRAEYKKTAIAYIIGGFLIFVTPQIISLIYEIVNS